jgi:hypothetical protein
VTQTTAKPATILPAWVELNALPSGLEDQIPAVRGYKYVKLQDRCCSCSRRAALWWERSQGSAKRATPAVDDECSERL